MSFPIVCLFQSLLAGAAQEPSALDVRVIDAQQRIPVAGAELRWFAYSDERLGRLGPPPDAYSVLLRDDLFGCDPFARSGEDGRARLAPTEQTGFLCVSSGGRRGCRSLPAGTTGEFELPLLRDWPLDVDIVDPARAPLDGLGVCLRYAIGAEIGFKDANATRVGVVDGRAHIEHAGYYQGACESGGAFYAGLTGWVGKPVTVWLPREEPPTGRVTLTLPPHGCVRIDVVDEDGQPAQALDPLCVGERWLLPEQVAWPVAPAGGALAGGQGFVALPLERGHATVAHVAVGAKLRARVQRNTDSTPTSIECPGPARAGETVATRLQLGSGLFTVRGQLRLPPGMSLGSLPPGFRGRLTFDADAARVASWQHELVLRCSSRDEREFASWHLWIEKDWSPGLHDLGEILLEPTPVFAAGRVLDARTHQPLAGVLVRLPQEAGWPPPGDPVASDAQGRFTLHADSEQAERELEFSRPGPDGAPCVVRRRVHRGARELLVELAAP